MTTLIAYRLIPSAAIFVLLLSILHYSEAIICYQCNSEYDPRCGDPFDPYTLGTVNCSFQPRLEHLDFAEPTLCRKTTQKVYGKTRVVRGCGFITDPKDNLECPLKTGTHDVLAIYCACTSDLCNGANSIYSRSLFDAFLNVNGILATGFALAWRSVYNEM